MMNVAFVLEVFRCIRISIRGLVRRLVGWLVGWSVMLSSKSLKNGLLRILNDSGSAGREKGGRGGRSDKESENIKKLLKN